MRATSATHAAGDLGYGSITPAVFIGVNGRTGIAIGFAAALGFALVPILFALGQRKLALDSPISEVKPDRDERVPLDLRL
jgi:hypothetical protein